MSIFGKGFSEDFLLEKITNDLNFEMAIRSKVDEIAREIIKERLSMSNDNFYQPVEETNNNIEEKVNMYLARLKERYVEEEKQYYYLKGKGISTELNDINFEGLKKDLEKKGLIAEILLDILQ